MNPSRAAPRTCDGVGRAVRPAEAHSVDPLSDGRERGKSEKGSILRREGCSRTDSSPASPGTDYRNHHEVSTPLPGMQMDLDGAAYVCDGLMQKTLELRENGKRPVPDSPQDVVNEVSMEAEQSAAHETVHLSWKDLFTNKSASSPFSIVLTESKRQKLGVPDSYFSSFGDYKRGWLTEDLADFCKASSPSASGKSTLKLSLSSEGILDTVAEYDRNGIVLYFMGRLPKGIHLRGWATKVLGANAIDRFIFLGKGFFLAICNEPKFKFMLLDKGGAWGNGLFGMAMPWHLSFDPMKAFLKFCPVWITFKEVPVFFLPHLTKIVAAMGKVLYIPTISQFVFSRNVKVCLLWDMEKGIPGYVEIDMGMENSAYIELSFNSFPTACYKCKTVGHFVKECPISLNMQPQTQGAPSLGQTSQLISSVLDHMQDRNADIKTIPLENRTLFVDLQIDPKNLNMGSMPKSELTLLNSLPQELIMKDKNTLEVVVNKKKHKKKKKRQSTTGIKENIENADTLSSMEDLDELRQDDSKLPAKVSAEVTETSEDASILADEVKDDVDLKVGDEVAEEGLTEDDKEILAAAPSFLRPFYSTADHLFFVPATIQKCDKTWVIDACGQSWDLCSFFKANNLSPSLVVFVTPEGDMQWDGSV